MNSLKQIQRLMVQEERFVRLVRSYIMKEGELNMIEETLCPNCNSKMVSRKNTRDGTRFWGCPNYPKCKGVRDSEGKSKQDRERERTQEEEY